MSIKRQPFWTTVQIGLWLHLALAGILLFQFFHGESAVFLWGLGLIIDWGIGSLYGRLYLKTWPVRLLGGALGGLTANLLPRFAAGMMVGLAVLIRSATIEHLSFAARLQWSFLAIGAYTLWGVIFGALGAAWSIVRGKNRMTLPQTLVTLLTIFGLWISQYNVLADVQDLQRASTPVIVDWLLAVAAVLFCFYIHDKTDGIDVRQFAPLLVFTVIGSLASLVYTHTSPVIPAALHGFPFGLTLKDMNLWTGLVDIFFWFNIALFLVGFRQITFIQYNRQEA